MRVKSIVSKDPSAPLRLGLPSVLEADLLTDKDAAWALKLEEAADEKRGYLQY